MLRKTICTALVCLLTLMLYATPLGAHMTYDQLPPDSDKHEAHEVHEIYDASPLISVKTLGGVTVSFDSLDGEVGDTVTFGIGLEVDFVLRGVEIFARAERTPIEFDVVGYYKYGFVIPEGGVDVMVRSEDHGTVSRAQAVTELWELAGSPVVNYAMTFTDVAPDVEYTEAVRWAASVGIVNGGEVFRPEDSLRREELAAVIYRYASARLAESESEKTEIESTGSTEPIAEFVLEAVDAQFISSWAYDSVEWCVEHGILDIDVGIAAYFRPQADTKCHELNNALNILGELMKTELGEHTVVEVPLRSEAVNSPTLDCE